METLLLTGASGFLGRNMLPRLHRRFAVTTLGRSGVNDISVDLSAGVPKLPGRYDIVVHAAGMAHQMPANTRQARMYHSVNVEGTRNLCRALEATGAPHTFVFLSSVSVYGADTGCGITEEHPLEGRSVYALSKIEAEHLLTQWCAANGTDAVILRPSLIVGDRPAGNLASMIRGIRYGYYRNIGRGNARRSLALAEDIANVVALCRGHSGIFNICTSESPTVGELAAHIAASLGKKHVRSISPRIASLLALPGEVLGRFWPVDSRRLAKMTSDLTFDNTRARTILGWDPMPALPNFHILR